ncbi:hypothetical protein BRC96_05765 [Halobacteriales archaeon QS_6_64_34]|nr:MAG: hypothetical protein BRC96_05765 [Halobacteriales archaeon QS_6_64_34]
MAGGGNNVLVVIDRPLPEVSVATLVDRLTNHHDDYLVKPVTTKRLRDTVDGLLALADYDATYRTLSQKRVEKSVLAALFQGSVETRDAHNGRAGLVLGRTRHSGPFPSNGSV